MDEPTFDRTNATLMEWRVLLAPADDAPNAIDVEHCVSEFRKRLLEERSKGMVPVGYGPVTGR